MKSLKNKVKDEYELDENIEDTELDSDEDFDLDDDFDDDSDEQNAPKKKGRPKSEHYVKESELRDEINASKRRKEKIISELTNKWETKIESVSTEPEKEALREEFKIEFERAETKTYCTPRLGEIVVLTVDRVATQTKFRHYTYLDDMKAEAIYQSIKGITKFDLDKTNDVGQKSSSFSYLTQIITNAFRQILKKEKKNREIKDQAIEMALNEHSDVEVDFESIKRKKEKLEMLDN